MGACTFQDVGFGKTAREAFDALVEDANDEFGHQQGYSGQINSVDSFVMSDDIGRKKINNHIDERLDHLEKGDCECLEVNGTRKAAYKEHSGKKGKRCNVYIFYGWAPE